MNGKVMIVDEQTGRIMEGRRYSDGLHQAIEDEKNAASGLHDKIKQSEKELSNYKVEQIAAEIPAMISKATIIDGIRVLAEQIPSTDGEQLKLLGDHLRNGLGKQGIGVLATVTDGKIQLVCVVTDDLTSRFQAGKVVGALAKQLDKLSDALASFSTTLGL